VNLRMLLRHLAPLSLVTAAMCLGCGPKSEGVPISGTVAFGGKSISSGAITFYPVKGRPIVVATNESGEYSSALPPGEYRVTLAASFKLPPGWKEGDPVPKQEIVIPAEYTTRARSPLKATVVDGQTEPIDFVLP
jgi:hypothetical protein